MSDNSTPAQPPDPITSSPLELYRRLRGAQAHATELFLEIRDIRAEYQRLRAHPEALEVDGLGATVDPITTTDAVITGLEQAGGQADAVHDRLEALCADHATRLKLTRPAARDLDTHRAAKRRSSTRTR